MNYELMMSTFALLVSMLTGGLSLWYSHKQHNQVVKAETLMHFTKTFHEVVETDSRPFTEKINDPVWLSSYWGLQGSEFYFFHHGTIPKQMYAIWMTDVADLYSKYPKSWDIHKKYLKTYGNVYKEMENFFNRIYEFSKISDKDRRYKDVKDFVYVWFEHNKAEF